METNTDTTIQYAAIRTETEMSVGQVDMGNFANHEPHTYHLNDGRTADEALAYFGFRRTEDWQPQQDGHDFAEVVEVNTYELYDYATAEPIRRATSEELIASKVAAERDGGAGVITVADQGDRRCYVA